MDFLKGKVVIGIVAVGLGYLSGFFFGSDNPIEEASEKFLKKEYNLDVELSPQNNHNKNNETQEQKDERKDI